MYARVHARVFNCIPDTACVGVLMLLRPHQWVRGRWPWGVLSIIIATQFALLPHFVIHSLLAVMMKIPHSYSCWVWPEIRSGTSSSDSHPYYCHSFFIIITRSPNQNVHAGDRLQTYCL